MTHLATPTRIAVDCLGGHVVQGAHLLLAHDRCRVALNYAGDPKVNQLQHACMATGSDSLFIDAPDSWHSLISPSAHIDGKTSDMHGITDGETSDMHGITDGETSPDTHRKFAGLRSLWMMRSSWMGCGQGQAVDDVLFMDGLRSGSGCG